MSSVIALSRSKVWAEKSKTLAQKKDHSKFSSATPAPPHVSFQPSCVWETACIASTECRGCGNALKPRFSMHSGSLVIELNHQTINCRLLFMGREQKQANAE